MVIRRKAEGILYKIYELFRYGAFAEYVANTIIFICILTINSSLVVTCNYPIKYLSIKLMF